MMKAIPQATGNPPFIDQHHIQSKCYFTDIFGQPFLLAIFNHPMKHLGFASISAVHQYLRYADAKHINTTELIQGIGISPELLNNDNGRIEGSQFQQLILGLIERANDPLLGLNSSLFVQPKSYNVLGLIALHCATISDAIERIPPFERLVGDMGTTSIQRLPNELIMSWHCAYSHPTVIPHMVDNVLASWTLFARWLAQRKANALRVTLKRDPPDRTLRKHYQQRFACPIHFACEANSIVLDHALLALPLQQGSQQQLATLEQKARRQLSGLAIGEEGFSQQVMRSIKAHLQMGVARKQLIAEEFNLSVRTIQRRLAEESSSYQKLLDSARFERATDLLVNTELPLKDIAYNIGFSDERSFYRSFKLWSKLSPGEFRQRAAYTPDDAT